MNKFHKYIKALYVCVISSLMLLVPTTTAFASDGGMTDIDLTPFVATFFAVIGLFIALIALIYFLQKHISEASIRIKRLSHIESEDTIQLYDDFEDAKWNEEVIPSDRPLDVLLDDKITKELLTNPPVQNSAPEEDPHGPTPERDMPGYDPNADEEESEPKPVSTSDMAYPQGASEMSESLHTSQENTQAAQPAYTYPADAQPIVYRPDSEVEIIMRDNYDSPSKKNDPVKYITPIKFVAPKKNNDFIKTVDKVVIKETVEASAEAEAMVNAAPSKVRVHRRQGRIPEAARRPLVIKPTVRANVVPMPVSIPMPVADRPQAIAEAPIVNIPTVADYTPIEKEFIFGDDLPRVNLRHLHIGPLGNAGGRESGEKHETVTYNFIVNDDVEAPASVKEIIEEAPIFDPSVPSGQNSTRETQTVTVIREPVDYEEAKVEIIPARRGANDKIVVTLGDDMDEGNLMRTLDDVLDELDEGNVAEIEATVEPAYKEELVFISNDVTTAEDIPLDDVFDDEEGEARMLIDGKYTRVRYRTSFMSRFIQSEERLQDYYSVIKNVLMSYDGVSSDISWSCETFAKDERICAKVNVKDKMLLLYLALDPERYQNSKYHYAYTYDKYAKYKNAKPSMMLKIKSDKALKYAIELIRDMMKELGITEGKTADIDYGNPYETTERLIERGLIKILPYDIDNGQEHTSLPDDESSEFVAEIIENKFDAVPVELDIGATFDFGSEVVPDDESVEENLEESIEEPVNDLTESAEEPLAETKAQETEAPIAEIIHADASEVDALLTDDEAIESIEIVEDETHVHTGKMDEVNLDSICQVFNDGDVVTIDELKSHNLVSRSASRVKILARGVMTKTLTIYADKFSLQAVKMITLAGGHAEQYK